MGQRAATPLGSWRLRLRDHVTGQQPNVQEQRPGQPVCVMSTEKGGRADAAGAPRVACGGLMGRVDTVS